MNGKLVFIFVMGFPNILRRYSLMNLDIRIRKKLVYG